MTARPDDIFCRGCGAAIVAMPSPFRAGDWYPHRSDLCSSCAERERETEERRECLARIDAQIVGIDDTLTSCGVSRRHVHATLDDFGTSYQAMHKGDRGLYICGPRGTGKTHLMAAIMRAMILDNLLAGREDLTRYRAMLPPLMISSTDLLRAIRATFSGNGPETEDQIIERYGLCPVLMLDDLGAEQATDWTLATLYSIIDRRYRDMRRSFVTSNLTPAELAKQTSDRITSRLVEMCRVVRLSGPDRRMKQDL